MVRRGRIDSAFGLTALPILLCAVMAATSTIRRVGDGVEYWAMAEQLAAFKLPSASRADILKLERGARRVGHGFELSPLRFPQLVAADGGQDFPHFWLYPLVTVPALWLTRLAGVHPNWAFTLTNCALLAWAFVVVARHVSVEWATLILVGPLIWWIDKAHGDVFSVSLLAASCALWRRLPGWTLVFAALAAAQNPALMIVWLLAALVAVVRLVAIRHDARKPEMVAQVARGVLAGAAIVAVPLAYYFTRLHVWSPLIGYTHFTWPSLRTILSLLCDPNVGLLANVPLFAAAMVWAVNAAWRQRRSSPAVWTDWLLAVGAWGLLLAIYTQSVNLNHGATPGINRWTLWLMPWLLLLVPTRSVGATATSLPWTEFRSRAAPAERVVGRLESYGLPVSALLVVALLNTVWAVFYFRPSLPEVYRYPTRIASWLWTNAPASYSPAPEIFAERVSHREPAVLPVAWGSCTKILVVDNEWPAPCLPPATMLPACRGPARLCYAASSGDEVQFVALGEARFPSTLAQRRWSADQTFVTMLRTRIEMGQRRDPQLRPRVLSESALRATTGVSWASVWMGASTIAVYLDRISSGALVHVRVPADYRGELIDLETERVLTHVDVPRSGERPTPLVLAATASHALLWLEADLQH
jgi:hypothetical protein